MFLKHISVSVLLSVIICFPVFAQTIIFQDTQHDFGDIKQGEKVTHEFLFSNSGPNELIIRKINSSCGCVAAVADTATVLAGQKSTIRVTFDSAGFSGNKLKTIRVYSNDSSNSSIVLKVGAKVIPEILAVPNKLELMSVQKNSSTNALIAFEKPWGTNPRITEVISKSQYLTVSFDNASNNVNVKVDSSAPLGVVQSRISVKTDSKNVPVINIPVTFEIVGFLDIAPKTLNLGLIDPNRTFPARRIKISRKDGKDIEEISSLTNENRGISVDIEPRTDTKHISLIVGVSDKSKSIIRGSFRFKVQGDDLEYSVPYYGVVDGL